MKKMELSAFDRIPPQNIEAEQAVLASMMLDRDAAYEVITILKPEDFYRESHGILFKSIIQLVEQGDPVDLITITEKLRQEGNLEKVGGVSNIAEIANAIGSSASILHYAQIVAEKALLRNLIRTTTNIANRSYEPGEEPDSLLDDAERMILKYPRKTGII